jgi:CHAT domain-containing protein
MKNEADIQLSKIIDIEFGRLPSETQQLISYVSQSLVSPGLESQRLKLFELLLTQLDRHLSPNLWAMLHYDFATTLLNTQTADWAENLEKAIIMFQASLEVIARDKSPLWASLQNNLGEAWRRRARGNRADNLELAIDAYMASLEVFTRNEYPVQWAALQKNLGAAYTERIMENRAENLEKAILAFQRALEVRTRADFPIDWAQTQYLMGRAFAQRVQGDPAQNFDQAVTAYKCAMEIFSQGDFPVQSADIQNALDELLSQRERSSVPEGALEIEYAQASSEIQQLIRQLWDLEDQSSDINRTRRLQLLEMGLKLVDQSRSPHLWAALQYDLGISLQSTKLGDRAENLERAIAVLTDLEVRTRDEKATNWANAKVELGNAFVARIRGDRADNLEKAIDAFTDALQVYSSEEFQEEWVMTQNNLSMAYFRRIRGDPVKNLEQSVDRLQAILKILIKDDSPATWALTQSNLAIVYSQRIRGNRSANLEKAIQCCNAALEVYTRSKYPSEWANVMKNLVGIYSHRIQGDRTENLEQALTAGRNALQVFTRADFPLDWAAVQVNFGVVYQERIKGNRAQNVEQAIEALNAALEVCRKDQYPEEWAKIQMNLSTAYERRIQGDRSQNLEQAIATATAAEQVYTPTDFPLFWAMVQNNLGNALRERIQGDRAENLEQAIDAFQDVLGVNTRKNFPLEWAQAQSGLGTVYAIRIRGNREENLELAIAAFNSALEVRKQADLPREWATTQVNLGVAYKERIRGDRAENMELAIAAFEAALKVYTKTDFPLNWAYLQNNLGNAYSNRIEGLEGENMEEAINAYKSALEIFTWNDFPIQWIMTQINLGDAYSHRLLGDPTESLKMAIAAYGDALNGAQEAGVKEYERGAAQHLGFLHYNEQHWPEVYKAVDTAINALEAMRILYFSEEAKIYLAEQNAQLYSCMVDTCLHLGYIPEALERAEAGKGRLFLDQLGSNSFPTPSLPTNKQSSLKKESESIAELHFLRNAILNTTDEAQRKELVAQQEKKQNALNTLWKQMESYVPEYVALRRGDPIKYNHIQALLDSFDVKAALVEFYSLRNKGIAFIMRSGGKEPVAVPINVSQEQLRHYLANYKREVWDYGRRGNIGQNWQELAKPLWEEIISFLDGIEMVYFVPHGLLHYFPMHAFSMNGKYLIDRFPIAYAPSAGVLDRVIKRNIREKQLSHEQDVLVLGYTKNESEREVFEGEAIQVANFFGTKAHLGKDATRTLLQKVGPHANILHLSCHGFFDSTNPMASGIQLADGVLTAHDIMSLRFNANLVTISSCQSGRSDIGSGDELVGLTRALLYAGASSVLVTLWSVNAVATLEIMEDFYHRFGSEDRTKIKTGAKALQEAMLQMRKKRDHPYFWAPFILVGDSR